MNLEQEISHAARVIYTDGYEMSLGEIMSLYKDNELVVNPEFQRLFRWTSWQKTKFIESLLLGIPVPPIFVFQTEDGAWELVDGLQRMSTVFEFSGILKKPGGGFCKPSTLEGTKLLPSLQDKCWDEVDGGKCEGIGRPLQLAIRRARVRVEILKKESDPQSKYELFQRLNTGGSELSEQEVRNCVMIMVNRSFFYWVKGLAGSKDFVTTAAQTDVAEKRQKNMELVLRFVAYRNVPYTKRIDVHEYLDDSALKMSTSDNFPYEIEEEVFLKTFDLINRSLSKNAFKRREGDRFLGHSMLAAYEAVAVGVSYYTDEILQMRPVDQELFVKTKVAELWNNATFREFSKGGVRGTARLANILPLIRRFFEP